MPNWKCVRNSKRNHRFFVDQSTDRLAIADQSAYLPEETEDGVLWVCTDQPISLHEGSDFRTHLSCNVITERNTKSRVCLSLAAAVWLHRTYKMPIQPSSYYHKEDDLSEIIL